MAKEILLQVIILISNILQVIAGFGGNMIAVPLSLRLMDLGSLKMVLNSFSLVGCIILMFQTWSHINWKEMTKMTVGMVSGMAIGVMIMSFASLDYLLYGYGVFVIIIGLCKLFRRKEIKCPHKLLLVVILVAGIIHGMFLSGGTMLVIYAMSVMKEKKEFRATLNCSWVFTGLIYMIYDIAAGNFTSINIMRSLIGMATLAVSIPVGNYLFNKIDQNRFVKMTYSLIVIAGMTMFI